MDVSPRNKREKSRTRSLTEHPRMRRGQRERTASAHTTIKYESRSGFKCRLKDNVKHVRKIIKLIPCNSHIKSVTKQIPYAEHALQENYMKLYHHYQQNDGEHQKIVEIPSEEVDSPLVRAH